jgi:hypothetical protein
MHHQLPWWGSDGAYQEADNMGIDIVCRFVWQILCPNGAQHLKNSLGSLQLDEVSALGALLSPYLVNAFFFSFLEGVDWNLELLKIKFTALALNFCWMLFKYPMQNYW